MPSSSSTENFGADYLDWKNWPGEAFGRFSAEDAAYYAAETGISQALPRRVLEIGFGNGQMLAWLRSTGAEVFGVEANPHLVLQARKLLGEEHAFADLSAPALQRLAGSFTHVIAIDVLEHVPQDSLAPLLAEMAALLTPTGRIVVRFPNGDSPFGRIYQHGDPTHVTTIGRFKLEYFARRAGLEVLELRAPALASGGGMRRALRQRLLRVARALFERVVGLLYYGGQRVPLDPNYVAVLIRQSPAN
jgi:SAM-dependent methyltransferase